MVNLGLVKNIIDDIENYGNAYIDWESPEKNCNSKSDAVSIANAMKSLGLYVYACEYGYGTTKQGQVACFRIYKDEQPPKQFTYQI